MKTKTVQVVTFANLANDDGDDDGDDGDDATAEAAGDDESSSLLNKLSERRPLILRHDSVFSVGTSYDDGSPNNLNVWQGAALLTADCMGTGILALPGDVQVLGYALGLSFLIANLPINLYAGTILSRTAMAVEEKQGAENQVFDHIEVEYPSDHHQDDDNDIDNNNNNNKRTTTDYQTMDTNNNNDKDDDENEIDDDKDDKDNKMIMIETSAVEEHSHLHHDTATFDFVGMTQALFRNRRATTVVMIIYYVNIFLVLGNYILVMSHAVSAVFGEDWLCLPVAGLIASTAMFAVSQSRTMARLGRTASVLSLTALFIVVAQCLWAAQQQQQQQSNSNSIATDQDQEGSSSEQRSLLRKLSAMGSIGFAVGSQKLFLNIRHEFADRQKAPQSLAISLTAFGAIYVFVILAAGSNPHGFLFDAIPAGGWNRRVAGLLLWAHVVVSYAINSQAICSSMDRLVWHRLIGTAADDDSSSTGISDSVRWMMLTGVMAIAAYTVANAIPFFKDLVALIGALTSVPLTLLFPAIFWRKHLHVPIWLPTRKTLCSYGLLLFAALFTVAATFGSVYSIRQDWKSHGPPFSCH